MNGKRAKQLRRMVKNSTYQSMENKEAPKYSFDQLQNYIALSMILTGEKPESIKLSDDYYKWYVQEANHTIDSLGGKIGFASEDPKFMGITLLKKSPVVVPGQN